MWCKFPKPYRGAFVTEIELLIRAAQTWCSSGPLHTETCVSCSDGQKKIIDLINYSVSFVNNLDSDHHDSTTFPLELNSLVYLSTPTLPLFQWGHLSWIVVQGRSPQYKARRQWESVCESASWRQINIYKCSSIYCTYSIFPVGVYRVEFLILEWLYCWNFYK